MSLPVHCFIYKKLAEKWKTRPNALLSSPHICHVIQNSLQPLCDLSHSGKYFCLYGYLQFNTPFIGSLKMFLQWVGIKAIFFQVAVFPICLCWQQLLIMDKDSSIMEENVSLYVSIEQSPLVLL